MAQQINLFNPIFLRQKLYFSAVAMAQALALIALGVLAIYVYQASQNAKLQRVAADAFQHLRGERRYGQCRMPNAECRMSNSALTGEGENGAGAGT